jgi:Tfp pilus assembly protein PilF
MKNTTKFFGIIVLVTLILFTMSSCSSTPTAVTADTYFQRGVQYFQSRNYQLAESAYSEAIKLDPDHFRAYAMRGTLYLGLAKNDLAVEDFTKVIQLESSSVDYRALAYLNRGKSYYALGEIELSISDFEEVLRSGTTNETVLNSANEELLKARPSSN